MPILLSDAERERFASYLEEEARTNDGLAQQADKLGPVGVMLAKKLRSDGLAASLVARQLRNAETMTARGTT